MSSAFLYVLAVVVWGSTWYAIDFQLGVVPVEVSLAYRYGLASALAFAWCLARGQSLRFGLRAHGWFVLLGLFMFGLNYLSAYYAQFYITSALNAIVFSSIIWMNIINARLFFGSRIGSSAWIGASLGVIGIFVIFWPEVQDVSLSDRVLTGMALSLTGSLMASFGNMVSQGAQLGGLSIMASNAWGMLYGSALCAAVALARGLPFTFDPSPAYVISLLFLAVFGSVIAFAAYFTLIGRIGVARAGYAAVMVPVVALLLSALFEGLELTPYLLVGMSLAVAGNVFILVRQHR